ncbi:MAG: BlaI/MecI/CopY family transcriptional regulator [Hymenobacter sp.]
MERLTQPEEDALRALWHTGPAFVKDVLARLPAPPPPYTTLASTLRNLERKAYVRAEKLGNSFRYSTSNKRRGLPAPLAGRAECASISATLIRSWFPSLRRRKR